MLHIHASLLVYDANPASLLVYDAKPACGLMPIGYMPVPFQVGLQILSRVSAFRVCHLSDIPGAAYAEEIELSVQYYGLHSGAIKKCTDSRS